MRKQTGATMLVLSISTIVTFLVNSVVVYELLNHGDAVTKMYAVDPWLFKQCAAAIGASLFFAMTGALVLLSYVLDDRPA